MPLDPNYPQHRLEYMLEDAAPIVVLTQEHLKGRAPTAKNVFVLDAQWDELAQESGTQSRQSVEPDGQQQPRLRDLHLRLDRSAEGRGD